MKHIIVFGLIAASILFFATRKSDLDKLLVPVTVYSEEQVGNRFVEPPTTLPTTPSSVAEYGVFTIVYFHDDQCPGCMKLDKDLVDFSQVRPDVAIRKVRMRVDGDAYWTAIRDYQWKIYASPCILIFGTNGKLIAADIGTDYDGTELLYKWMKKELEKAG